MLQEYDYTPVWIPGKQNEVADCGSRLPVPEILPPAETLNPFTVDVLEPLPLDELKQEQQKDPFLGEIYKYFMNTLEDSDNYEKISKEAKQFGLTRPIH